MSGADKDKRSCGFSFHDGGVVVFARSVVGSDALPDEQRCDSDIVPPYQARNGAAQTTHAGWLPVEAEDGAACWLLQAARGGSVPGTDKHRRKAALATAAARCRIR